MLAKAPIAIIPSLTPADHARHALHGDGRDWPETNCYIDVWIEILHACRLEPLASLGFTVAQDFEGDHFTFTKMPLEDLADLYGIAVQELALYDTLESHLLEQTRRGRMVIVEVDGFFLPDTRGIAYGIDHSKTTIAVNRIDPGRREIDYFHGPGFHALRDDDYDAIMRHGENGLFPYAEFAKFDRRKVADGAIALTILRRHLTRRVPSNPVAAFRERVRDQIATVAERPDGFVHKYAFNTARQLGMNFELLGAHIRWLQAEGQLAASLQPAVESCQALSSGAKTFQFQLARAAARKRFDGIETLVDPLVDHYDALFESLAAI